MTARSSKRSSYLQLTAYLLVLPIAMIEGAIREGLEVLRFTRELAAEIAAEARRR